MLVAFQFVKYNGVISMTNNSDHIFSNVDIRKLLIPIMLENLLASLMGTVDTMTVSYTHLTLPTIA